MFETTFPAAMFRDTPRLGRQLSSPWMENTSGMTFHLKPETERQCQTLKNNE